jgi:nucleoside-diphosphate-sugar epimerase
MHEFIHSVEELEDLLSKPSTGAIESIGRLDGDLMLLGVAGKMGPTLARMALRASQLAGIKRRIIGVSRFTQRTLEDQLQEQGIETISCDLLDSKQVQELPLVPNIIFMTGMKFGSQDQQALTWAMNTHIPALIAQRFSQSKIVAFSTGNVYGLSSIESGGSLETDLLAPVGEYAMSCVGRERIFEYFSQTNRTPMTILRLNYATELRYGVLGDIARKVYSGEPIDLRMGYFNAIWQGDANAMSLQTFDHVTSPPQILNLAGPELLNVRTVAETFANRFQIPVRFTGIESSDALLNNARLSHRLFGSPRISASQMIDWIAQWVQIGGRSLDKPTHFEVLDGKFK